MVFFLKASFSAPYWDTPLLKRDNRRDERFRDTHICNLIWLIGRGLIQDLCPKQSNRGVTGMEMCFFATRLFLPYSKIKLIMSKS